MSTLRRHLSIHGRVQGVGYRWSLCATAIALGLAGWVRNRHDGSVEALIEGPPEAVDALTQWARRGPPEARVERVDGTEQASDGAAPLTGFEKKPTC